LHYPPTLSGLTTIQEK